MKCFSKTLKTFSKFRFKFCPNFRLNRFLEEIQALKRICVNAGLLLFFMVSLNYLWKQDVLFEEVKSEITMKVPATKISFSPSVFFSTILSLIRNVC